MDDAQGPPTSVKDSTSQQTVAGLPPRIMQSLARTMARYRSETSRETLEARVTGAEHIRLPYDVIEVIAQCLAQESLMVSNDGRPRTTLARLNRVSKAVHEVTLPVLYETTDYFDKEDFTESVKPENPKGWTWTKYLSLGSVSEGLLCLHQRYLRGLYDALMKTSIYRRAFHVFILSALKGQREI